MAKVAADISMSLGGFVAGPGDGPELPLGKGGERLHEWVCGLGAGASATASQGGETGVDAELLDEAFTTTGAVG